MKRKVGCQEIGPKSDRGEGPERGQERGRHLLPPPHCIEARLSLHISLH
jgi:hypothetical protein